MSLRDIERGSIRAFLEEQSGFFAGARVLDYGCGDQPYRELIEQAGGNYFAYDNAAFPGNVASDAPRLDSKQMKSIRRENLRPFDVIVCTQALQYIPLVAEDSEEETIYPLLTTLWEMGHMLGSCRDRSKQPSGGVLLATGPMNWPMVEAEDLHRFTPNGVARLLHASGFVSTHVEVRASVQFEGETWPLGWQAIARP